MGGKNYCRWGGFLSVKDNHTQGFIGNLLIGSLALSIEVFQSSGLI